MSGARGPGVSCQCPRARPLERAMLQDPPPESTPLLCVSQAARSLHGVRGPGVSCQCPRSHPLGSVLCCTCYALGCRQNRNKLAVLAPCLRSLRREHARCKSPWSSDLVTRPGVMMVMDHPPTVRRWWRRLVCQKSLLGRLDDEVSRIRKMR